MIKGENSIYPSAVQYGADEPVFNQGLNIRTHLAASILNGMMANPNTVLNDSAENYVELSLKLADKLIDKLNTI